MKKLDKKAKILIVVVATIILSVGGTLAWLEWVSPLNANVYGDVCAPQIVFVGGNTINGVGISPTTNLDRAIKKEINVNLQDLCEDEVATMDLKLELTTFPVGLADSSFVWKLYKGNTLVTNGNFADKEQGDVITLISGETITELASNYTLYIYLDGSVDNPASTQNKSFTFNIYGEGLHAKI